MSKRKSYTEEDMKVALNRIEEGLPIHKASKLFNIPRGTIQNRLHGRNKRNVGGPPSILSGEEEKLVVSWLLSNQEKGFPRRKQDIQVVVKEFLDTAPRKNPFNDNMPGEKWYKSFLKRHPNLSVRTPEAITDASSKVSERDIRGWFGNIKSYLERKGYQDIMKDPERIFNGDETNFLLCPKIGKVLAGKGSRNVYETDHGQAKENLTVMFSFSASGYVVPPMIVYPYKRMKQDIIDNLPDGIKWQKSDSGWMTTEVFCFYVEHVFSDDLRKKNITFPVIFFVDGHKTHMTYQLANLCDKLHIILICLYPNSTRILQPADVSIFRPLKIGWQKSVNNWRRNCMEAKITKAQFAPILKTLIDTCIKSETIRNGFRTCGLYPFNADAIDYSKCLGRSSNRTITENEANAENQLQITEHSINLQRFREIVGEVKMLQLENFETSPCTYSEDFIKLFEVYKDLKITSQEQHPTPEATSGVCITHQGNESLIFEYDQFEAMAQNAEILDEFNIMDMSMVYANNNNVAISNFLTVPETPIRKGIRHTERKTFIISSTPFREAEEDKREKKAAEQKLKEERKIKTENNKERKEEIKKTRAKNKMQRNEKARFLLKQRQEKTQTKETVRNTTKLKRSRVSNKKTNASTQRAKRIFNKNKQYDLRKPASVMLLAAVAE